MCGILAGTQLMGVWLAAAQTNTRPATKPQSYAVQANPGPVATAATAPAKPAIAVSPRTLEFAPVGVGKSRNLSFTVKNVGAGTITGDAKVSAPFRVIGGTPYVLQKAQSQVITVEYLPRAAGMNVSVVVLTGGGGASITVAGSAFPPRRTAPAPPKNLRMLAGPCVDRGRRPAM